MNRRELDALIHFERRFRHVDATDDAGRHAGRGAARRHRLEHDRTRRDLGAGADLDVAEHLGAGAQQYAAPHLRMTVAAFLAGTAQGDAMQHRDAVLDHGATRVIAAATHGVLSGPAIERISNSRIEKVLVSDTIIASESTRSCRKIEQVSVADLFAEAIHRILNYDSVSSLFI